MDSIETLRKSINDLADERHKVEQRWYQWRLGVDDRQSKHESTMMSIAENLHKVSYVKTINGKEEIKPIEVAIGEIWESTALLRTGNKILFLINRRPLSRKLFKWLNVIVVTAIIYAIFGYAIFGVPLIKLIDKWIH